MPLAVSVLTSGACDCAGGACGRAGSCLCSPSSARGSVGPYLQVPVLILADTDYLQVPVAVLAHTCAYLQMPVAMLDHICRCLC